MKILLIGSYFPTMGGAERALHELCLNLSNDKKIDFFILCPDTKGTLPKDSFKAVRAWTLIKDIKKVEKTRILEYVVNYSFVLPAIISGWKVVKNKKIGLIHVQFGLAHGLVGVVLKKLCKIPMVTTLHGGGLNFQGFRRIFRPLTRWVLKNSDAIVAVSKAIKKIAKKELSNKIVVVPNSIFPNEFKNKEEEFVLSVGRLAELKNFDMLVRAATDPRLKEIKFRIVGDGPEKNNLNQLIAQLKLSNFKLIGTLPHNETKKMMSRCSIFCLPSKSEGLPLVVLEAMACKKPVIGTMVGGIPEIIKDGKNGFLIKVGDYGKLSELIYKLIKNKKLRKEMGNNSRKRILSEFDWKKNVKKIKKIYSRVLNSK